MTIVDVMVIDKEAHQRGIWACNGTSCHANPNQDVAALLEDEDAEMIIPMAS